MNSARSLAGATLAFAIVSCLGFVIPAYWFPGLGGLLGIIGTSIIICCAGKSRGGHIACAVLCALAACLHAAGIGIYIWYYAEFSSAIAEVSSTSTELEAQVVTAWVSVVIWPAVVLNCISFVLEVIQAVFCFKAASAIADGELPTSVKSDVQA